MTYVAGDPWAVGAIGAAGNARTAVRAEGESWSSTAGADTGVTRVKANVTGEPWSSTAGADTGIAKTQVVVRGDAWSGSAAANAGTTIIEPEPVDADFDVYPSDVYRYFVFDILTDELLAEVQMNDVSFSTKLNAVGDFSGTVYAIEAAADIDLYWATMPMKTALYVLRGEKALWGGIIWNREYDAETKTVSISAGTWESYLFRRYSWHTWATTADVDQYDTVRQILRKMRQDFIKDYLASDYVTPAPFSSAVDIFVVEAAVAGKTQESITFLREEMKSFGDVLSQFSDNIDGFEWYFAYTYNKEAQRFRRLLHFIDTPPALMKKGAPEPTNTEADKPGIDTYLFEYPGNIITIQLAEDGDNACTRQFVVGGPPEGSTIEGFRPIGSWNNDHYLNMGFPLIENVESSKHATTSGQKRLNRLATVYGRETAPPIRRWSVVVNGSLDPIVGTYRVGKWCRLIMDDEFIKQSLAAAGHSEDVRGVVKRIVGITVNVPTGPQLPDTVTLELEDDVVVSWEPSDDVDEFGEPIPGPVTIYPTGTLVGESGSQAGAPKILGSSKQWSDSSSDTWGQLKTWQSGSSSDTDFTAITTVLPAQNVEAVGKSVLARLNLQAMDAGVFHPAAIEVRNSTTNEICLVANPPGVASIAAKFLQWTMVEVGGGLANFEAWMAAGQAELRVEAGHMPGPSASGNDTTYRLRIYEARLVIS